MGFRYLDNLIYKKIYYFIFLYKFSFLVIFFCWKWLNGVQYGDEMWFIFRNKNFNYIKEEEKLNDNFVKYLINFVKFGYVLQIDLVNCEINLFIK